MEQKRPCPINLTESHVFTNGGNVLTETGSGIQYIRRELNFLQESWNGHGKISPERQDEIIGGIAEKFVEISESLGIPSDLSLIPDVVGQYKYISARRNSAPPHEPVQTPA